MSAIASFYVVNRDDLSTVSAAAGPASGLDFDHVVDTTCHDLGDVFLWSGHVFIFLMDFLRERGVHVGSEFAEAEDQLNSATGVGAYVFTPADFGDLSRLDPDLYEEADIRSFFNEFGMGFDDAGIAAKDGVALLAEQVRKLGPDRALIVLVG